MTVTSPGAKSTADEVLERVDLSGKRILVTGVSAGLGAETARVLTAHGAHVVGAARDLKKAMAATEPARAQAVIGGGLELVELDLASLASVRACADAFVAADKPLDLVIANAAVMACPMGLTSDGYETHFGTNYLGHFVLINRVASLLKPGSRVLNLTSWGHNYSDINLDDPNFEHTPYEGHAAYGRSKTANILFAVEFDSRHKAAGVRAAAVNPGGIHTELYRHMDQAFVAKLFAPESSVPEIKWKNAAQGVATSVWAGIVAPADEVGGRYCEDCHVAEINETGEGWHGVRPYAINPDRARMLWAKSEEMVGERF